MEQLDSLVSSSGVSNKINQSTHAALYGSLFSGRNFRGEYVGSNTYKAGDIVVLNKDGKPTLFEAKTDILPNTPFTKEFWAEPAIGQPYSNCGVITLTNTQKYPLNDSARVITLDKEMKTPDYHVLVTWNDKRVDEVEVFDKMTNTFSMRYWGYTDILKVQWAIMREN